MCSIEGDNPQSCEKENLSQDIMTDITQQVLLCTRDTNNLKHSKKIISHKVLLIDHKQGKPIERQ